MKHIEIDERSSEDELVSIFAPHAQDLRTLHEAARAQARERATEQLPLLGGMAVKPGLRKLGAAILSELKQEHPPSAREIRAWGRVVDVPAEEVVGLNAAFTLSFACTSGVTCDGGEAVHARTRDWDLPALVGRTLRGTWTNDTGTWTSLTPPGMAGALTVLRPEAYSVSLNHAPFSFAEVWKGRAGWDPLLALRRAVSQEPTFDGLVANLRATPLTASCIYVAASADGRAVRLERSGHRSVLLERDPVVAANLFDAEDELASMNEKRDDEDPLIGTSEERHRKLLSALTQSNDPEALMATLRAPPIWNEETLYAVVMRPAAGKMTVHER